LVDRTLRLAAVTEVFYLWWL